MEEFTLLWNEYYPIVVTGLVALGGFIGLAYIAYIKVEGLVSPIIKKIQDFRAEDDEKASVASIFESINMDILKADLLTKIENTSVSPALTLVYETQLARLEALTASTTSIIEKVEDTKDTYLG